MWNFDIQKLLYWLCGLSWSSWWLCTDEGLLDDEQDIHGEIR